MSLIITILAFIAGCLVIFAVNLVVTDIFQEDQKRIRKRMEEEMLLRERERARQSVSIRQPSNLDQLAQEAMDQNEQQSMREKLSALLDQAGMRVTTGSLLAISGGIAAVVGLLALVLSGSLLIAGAAAGIGVGLPLLYVQFKRKQRLERLRAQLPDTFDLMARVLRAGQTISQAMQSVAQEFQAPVATEFGYCYEQQNLGLPTEVALRDLARRTGLIEIKIFVVALLVHRQAGGNMTELLSKLASIVRQRFEMRGKVQALTAEGRFQAVILLGLPPAVWLLMLFLNRDYALELLDHHWLVLGTLLWMGVGALWIRKIINFDF